MCDSHGMGDLVQPIMKKEYVREGSYVVRLSYSLKYLVMCYFRRSKEAEHFLSVVYNKCLGLLLAALKLGSCKLKNKIRVKACTLPLWTVVCDPKRIFWHIDQKDMPDCLASALSL